MVWPTDDLTTAHLDSSTDDPGLARAELKAAVDKIKSILAEVPSGSTVWHSSNDGPGGTPSLDAATLGGAGKDSAYHLNLANSTGSLAASKVSDGPGSGLNADQLDNQDGSYYRDLGNATGTLSTARIGTDTITAAKIAANAIGNSELASNAVNTVNILNGAINSPKLATTTDEQSSTSSSTDVILASYGEYGFNNQTRMQDTSPRFYVSTTGTNGSSVDSGEPFYGHTDYRSYVTCSAQTTGERSYARVRYITGSPPYNLGDGEVLLFVWLKLSSSGDIITTQTSRTPPWAYNGPTNITADRYDTNGKGYKTIRQINEIDGSIETFEREVDFDFKNSDMDLIPHPFVNVQPDENIILLDPPDTLYIMELFEMGESIIDLMDKDYLRLDNETIKRSTPNGVLPAKFKWKNTRARVGEATKDRRMKRGVFSQNKQERDETRRRIVERRANRRINIGENGRDNRNE
jgi:hypothetical protein